MFFTYASLLMLLCALAGFAPTFFLRPVYYASPLPSLLIVHGIVMTAWFVVLPVQSYLAESRRIRWHRPLGWISVGIAAAIVLTSPAVLMHSVPHGLAKGIPGFAVSFVFMTGVLRILFFVAMVATAIWWRRQRTIHARALFLASLSNLAPALARVAEGRDWNPVPITFLYLIPFGLALVLHDRRVLTRTHRLTGYGMAANVLILLIPIALLFAGATSVIVASVH
ncbi:MAG: hypothetical protein U0Q11_17560 [Vicinamibacterales bacterium]